MSISSKQIETILKRLRQLFPNPGAMHLVDPYRTLVGVILSARTRDEQVLKLLPDFFGAFPSPLALAHASETDIRSTIPSIGMFRQKAKNLKKMAGDLVEQFRGEVPKTMEDLTSLAGVGRKTASVLLVACFETPAIAVDTHVFRVTNRLGWVKTNTPEKTETALLKLVPKKFQPLVNSAFVKFGRYVCIPGKPRCWMCPVKEYCAFNKKQLTSPPNADEIKADIARRERELEAMRERVTDLKPKA